MRTTMTSRVESARAAAGGSSPARRPPGRRAAAGALAALALGPPAGCGAEREAPTVQERQAASLSQYVDSVVARAAFDAPPDVEALRARETAAILAGDGSPPIFLGAMMRAQQAFGRGHHRLVLADGCDASRGMPGGYGSRFGVCGRPLGDAVVVTFARPGNPLGLSAGDRVVAVGDERGPALLERAAERPACSYTFPSPEGLRYRAALAFFSTVPPNATLEVISPSDETRSVVVPEGPGEPEALLCLDPFGRPYGGVPATTLRGDGVAVIRAQSFDPKGLNVDPADPERHERVLRTFDRAFAAARGATGIVWDVRANEGGYPAVASALAGGLPGARPGPVQSCARRLPGDPPAEPSGERGTSRVVPTGRFAAPVKMAIVIDGGVYSAGDVFALAARTATDVPFVGSATAGAFSTENGSFALEGPPALYASLSEIRCVDPTGAPLEGRGVEPDVPVAYDPRDLAAGVDTLIEAAAAVVK